MEQIHTPKSHHASEAADSKGELNEYGDVYQDLFDHVPCFITVQDKNYKLLRYNREFKETFAPMPGDFCYQAYKGREEKCPVCPVEQTFQDGESHLSEESGPNKDGTTLHWVVKTSPIKNSRGDIVAVMEMCLDITHKKKLEEKLEKSESRYRGIFNNIPNPLFVLDAETLEILDCNSSVETVYGYPANEIFNNNFLMFFNAEERDDYASLLRHSKIINHMREFGRKSDLSFEKVCINDVFKRTCDVLDQQLKVRGIEVIWGFQEDLPLIKADSLRLEQVFINLLLNARDAIEEKLERSKDASYAGEINLKTSCHGDEVTVEICDNGPGIPESLKNKIFEPFFTSKEVGKGTGLGLSISYGIIRECGGRIQAVSRNNLGTCFVITLPALR